MQTQMDNSVAALIALIGLLAIAYGIAYWAFRARTDRSAFVGLYLLFGIPGALLTIAGLVALLRKQFELAPVLLLLGLGLLLPLLPQVRQALARVLPIDPASPVDMTGLSIVLGVCGFLAAPIFTGPSAAPDAGSVPVINYLDLAVQGAVFLLIAYMAVGWPISRFDEAEGKPRVRSLSEATARLGIVMPDPRTIGWGLGATLACFLVAGLAGYIGTLLQPGMGEGVSDVVEAMTGNVLTVPGAVLLGLSAGVGEEAIFRGALQPRLGIVLTSVAFALMHGGQYGLNFSIVGLFLVSVVLGLTRKYGNTTAAIIAHALYDTLQVLALVVAARQ
ncbi:MAG: CPBP family intramembrane glutamic endopeptidase [Thermomicrobiales bacterium]